VEAGANADAEAMRDARRASCMIAFKCTVLREMRNSKVGMLHGSVGKEAHKGSWRNLGLVAAASY